MRYSHQSRLVWKILDIFIFFWRVPWKVHLHSLAKIQGFLSEWRVPRYGALHVLGKEWRWTFQIEPYDDVSRNGRELRLGKMLKNWLGISKFVKISKHSCNPSWHQNMLKKSLRLDLVLFGFNKKGYPFSYSFFFGLNFNDPKSEILKITFLENLLPQNHLQRSWLYIIQ